MKKLIFFLFAMFLIPVLLSGSVIISGRIINFNKAKLIFHIYNTSDISFEKYEEKIPVEVHKDGTFRKELEIDCPLLVNIIETGNHPVYFGMWPSDSIFISMDYKTGLKNYLLLLESHKNKYALDTAYVSLQKQEIIYNFYNDVATFDKRSPGEPYLECYDTANILNNSYLKNNIIYFSVLTGYMRWKFQQQNNTIPSDFQSYYLSFKYLKGELLEKYLAYFLMFHFNFSFSEQTIDELKELYLDYRKNHTDKTLYSMVTKKAIEIRLIRRNE